MDSLRLHCGVVVKHLENADGGWDPPPLQAVEGPGFISIRGGVSCPDYAGYLTFQGRSNRATSSDVPYQ